MEVIFYF